LFSVHIILIRTPHSGFYLKTNTPVANEKENHLDKLRTEYFNGILEKVKKTENQGQNKTQRERREEAENLFCSLIRSMKFQLVIWLTNTLEV